jgi:hypothetical protein
VSLTHKGVVTLWLCFSLQYDSEPSPDFLAKILGVNTQLFFNSQFYFVISSRWVDKPWSCMQLAISQLVACSPAAQTLCIWSSPHSFFSLFRFSTVSLWRPSFLFSFHSLCFIFYFLSLLFHIWEQEERSRFLNTNDWKFTDILQHWSFTKCQNGMEYITLGWQVCSIADITCCNCNESKNSWHHEHLSICLMNWFRTFYLNHGGSPP